MTLLAEDRPDDALEYFWRSIGMPQEMVDEMRQTPRWAELEAMAPTMAYDSEVMGDIGRGGAVPTDLAGRVRCETLVLVGGASPEWMIDVARQVADALPHGRYRVLEGQEHVVPPEILVPVLAEFLADENGATSTLIHPSDPWPGHPAAMKMELPPRLVSLREYGWRLTSGRSDPYFHGPTATCRVRLTCRQVKPTKRRS